MRKDLETFYKGKRIFVTGHTGFKGSWLCKILSDAGAEVTGYSLEPPTDPNLFSLANIGSSIHSVTGDIRNSVSLERAFNEANPEIVFHLAAQPIVRESYKSPVYTYETNVMGTVNILECVRNSDSVKSVLNVTTDKVYQNNEWCWGYRETDPLDGYDPYSNSKSCSELVTHSYCNSFLRNNGVAVSTARAGNVMGGGDFAADRIIPDCVRAAVDGKPIVVRNPQSVRPYQHVLEPLFAYCMIAQEQFDDPSFSGAYNVGPDECDCVTTGRIVELFCNAWQRRARWECKSDSGPHEAGYLKLDCSKIKQRFCWKPTWGIEEAVFRTVEWTNAWQQGDDVGQCMAMQIDAWRRDAQKEGQ